MFLEPQGRVIKMSHTGMNEHSVVTYASVQVWVSDLTAVQRKQKLLPLIFRDPLRRKDVNLVQHMLWFKVGSCWGVSLDVGDRKVLESNTSQENLLTEAEGLWPQGYWPGAAQASEFALRAWGNSESESTLWRVESRMSWGWPVGRAFAHHARSPGFDL